MYLYLIFKFEHPGLLSLSDIKSIVNFTIFPLCSCAGKKVNLLADATPFSLYLFAKFHHALAADATVRAGRPSPLAESRFCELVTLGGEYSLFYEYLCKVSWWLSW